MACFLCKKSINNGETITYPNCKHGEMHKKCVNLHFNAYENEKCRICNHEPINDYEISSLSTMDIIEFKPIIDGDLSNCENEFENIKNIAHITFYSVEKHMCHELWMKQETDKKKYVPTLLKYIKTKNINDDSIKLSLTKQMSDEEDK